MFERSSATRRYVVLALALALVPTGVTASAETFAPPSAGGRAAHASPKTARRHVTATPTPTPAPSASHVPESTAPEPATAPPFTPRPDVRPTAVPSAASSPGAAGPSLPPFVPLRDRYRRDDQGAALRKPVAQLAGLNYLLGVWNAHIFSLDDMHRVERDFGRTTYVFARTMDDRWILGTDAKNTEFLLFTYDPAARRWIYDDLKSFPSYGLSYATGGDPRRLVFRSVTNTALGEDRTLRTTLTALDARRFTLFVEERTPADAWTPVVEFDFTRS